MTAGPLPNLVIAGVGKAGTTSLFWYLAQHPAICHSQVKEIDYFAPLRDGLPLRPLADYAANFRHWSGQPYRLEASPGYLYGGVAVRDALAETLPGARLLLLLRDPAERVFPSFRYLHSRLQLPESMSYREYVDECLRLREAGTDGDREHRLFWTVSAGFYGEHLPQWMDRFGDQLKVLFYDDLAAAPQRVVSGLCEWLDIDRVVASAFDYRIQNRTVSPRHRGLQSVALKVNRTRLFTEHRRFKAPLRALYHTVNGKPRSDRPDPETQRLLADLYAPANRVLGEELRGRGYTELPAWLAGPQSVTTPVSTLGRSDA